MSDDTSGPLSAHDPLEDYMASFFPRAMSEPLKPSVNTLTNVFDDSTAPEVTGLLFDSPNDSSNNTGITTGTTSARPQHSVLPKLTSQINSVNRYSKPSLVSKAYLAEQLPRDVLLDTDQKQHLQKLLDETLNKPLLDATSLPEADAMNSEQNVTLNQSYLEPQPQPQPQPQLSLTKNLINKNEASNAHVSSINDLAVLGSDVLSLSDTLDTSSDVLNASSAELNTKTSQDVVARAASALLDKRKPAGLNRPATGLVDYRSGWQNNKPSWGQRTFDALLFKCRGVTLAIPLASLGHIYLHNEALKKLPHLPAWVLGVKPLAQGSLKVIDAGQYFLSERPPSLDLDGEWYVLAVADCLWGLAVDSLSNPISVKLDDVQWRPLSPHNPWLAGTIKKQMCVLIDTPALLAFLNTPSI